MRHGDRRAERDATGDASCLFPSPSHQHPLNRWTDRLPFPEDPALSLPSLPFSAPPSLLHPSWLRPRVPLRAASPGSRATPPRPHSSPGTSAGQDRTIHLHGSLPRLQAGTRQQCDSSAKVCPRGMKRGAARGRRDAPGVRQKVRLRGREGSSAGTETASWMLAVWEHLGLQSLRFCFIFF